MREEIVRLSGVTVRFDGETVLDRVDFIVHERDYVGMIGPNGGGKTTLLKVVLGLVTPIEGEVSVLGMSPRKGRRHVGYVPQHAQFDRDFPISVWEVALMGRLSKSRPLRRYGTEDRKSVEQALEKVGMLRLKDRQMGMLSGGERQRVYIARALASHPKMLLLDEPTANIDIELESGFYELLNQLKGEMAIVLVSHDISVISVNVEKIACLNKQLFMHDSSEITEEALERTYRCPVEMIAHGVPHRVLKEH